MKFCTSLSYNYITRNGINVENAFFISSVTGFNIDSLCRKVNEMINNDKEKDDDNFDQKSSNWEP